MAQHGRVWTVLAVALSLISALAVRDGRAAGDIAAGRQKALMCQTCHGLDGKSKFPRPQALRVKVPLTSPKPSTITALVRARTT